MKLTKHNPDTDQPLVEVVEVEVERLGVMPTRREVLMKRTVGVLKPVVLGLLVDAGDLISGGPFFLPIGVVVGYLFARWLDAPPTWCVVIAGVVGVYWMTPFTNFMPLAAPIAAFVYIFKPEMMERDPILDREGAA